MILDNIIHEVLEFFGFFISHLDLNRVYVSLYLWLLSNL